MLSGGGACRSDSETQEQISSTESIYASEQLLEHPWKLGDVVWVEEGTQPGVRGHRAEPYKGRIVRIDAGHFMIAPIFGGKHREEKLSSLKPASVSGLGELGSRGGLTPMPVSAKRALRIAATELDAVELKLSAQKDAAFKASEKAKVERKAVASEKALASAAIAERDSIFRGEPSQPHFSKQGKRIVAIVRREAEKDMRRLKFELEKSRRCIESQKATIGALASEKDAALAQKRALAAARRADKARIEALEFQVAELPKVSSALAEERGKVRRLSGEIAKADAGMQVLNALPRLGRESSQRGRPYSEELDRHIYALLATGASARCVREHMRLNFNFLIPVLQTVELPKVDYIEKKRIEMGLGSQFYAVWEIAQASEIHQCGWDETKMEYNQSTANLWVRITDRFEEVKTITMEAIGILIGGTAEEIGAHIDEQFKRADALNDKLRAQLLESGFDPDVYAPKVQGGVNLSKIKATMHDTCNTANKSAVVVARLAAKSGEELFGADVWAAMPVEKKKVYDHLCANHTRGLPIDEFDRQFKEYFENIYGEAIKDMKKTNSKLRLETDGKSLVFSLLKMCHRGHGEYAKSLASEVFDALQAADPLFAGESPGRAAVSKRQDGVMEQCSLLYSIRDAILAAADKQRQVESHVLSDSCLVRFTGLHNQAYIHVLAIVWLNAFEELRALTNSSAAELNPLELSKVYDKVWEYASVLQGSNALSVLDINFRAWERLPSMAKWYANREKKQLLGVPGLVTKRAKLGSRLKEVCRRVFDLDARGDRDRYEPILLEVLDRFGKSVHVSFRRTMKEFLEVTDGKSKASSASADHKAAALLMLCHNNAAERPFAVGKLLAHDLPSLTLAHKSHTTHAMVNKTYQRPASPVKEKGISEQGQRKRPGVAFTAPAPVTQAIMQLCSRKGKSSVVEAQVAMHANDLEQSRLHEKKRKQDKLDVALAKRAKCAASKDAYGEIELVTSLRALSEKLAAKRSDSSRVNFILEQLKARTKGKSFTYDSSIGSKFVSKSKKLVQSVDGGVGQQFRHLSELITAVIKYDIALGRYTTPNLAAVAAATSVARYLPAFEERFLSSKALSLREDERKAERDLAIHLDDPELIQFETKYVGKVFLDEGCLFKVLKISIITKKDREIWEVTCVELDNRGNVPAKSRVDGGDEILDSKLVGYGLKDSMGTPYAPIDDMISDYQESCLQLFESKKSKHS